MYSDLNYEVIDGVRTLRFSGTFNDPNYFSVMLILGILLCIRGLQAPGADKGRSADSRCLRSPGLAWRRTANRLR